MTSINEFIRKNSPDNTIGLFFMQYVEKDLEPSYEVPPIKERNLIYNDFRGSQVK